MATGYPDYNRVILRETVAIGEVLRQHGYDLISLIPASVVESHLVI